MTQPADIPAIEKTVTVPLPPKEAFRVFTADLNLWWPVDSHSLSANTGDMPRKVELEPRDGGRITETLADGRRADWATITDWRPGEAFALDWYVGRDPSEATQVRVRFEAEGPGTRVILIHDGFDRLGAGGPEMAANYTHGWDGVLGNHYCPACLSQAA